MSFYEKLQLDPFVIKTMIHKSESPKERKQLFGLMFLRSVLLVTFAIFFISVITLFFGAKNSYLAVVLFCMLLSIRFVHFGYKLSQSLIGLAVIMMIFGLMPLIGQVQVVGLRFLINLLFLSTILLITSNQPKMGNPGLYSFAYVFLTGTSLPLNVVELKARGELLGLFLVLFSILFIIKHRHKELQRNFHEVVLEHGLLSKRNLWLFYYAIGVSSILQLGYLISLKRFMWVGIAFSSLISVYELTNIKQRMWDRLIGVLIGSSIFFILAQLVPTNILAICGGVALGLCTTYRFKNIFNCFGALALAATLFGAGPASLLRITNNFLGLLLGFLYLLAGQMIYRRVKYNNAN